MKRKALLGGIILIVLILGAYFILAANNRPPYGNQVNKLNLGPTVSSKQPLTAQNEDQALTQTDASINTQLNQMDQELKAWDQANVSSSSHDNISSINNL